MSVKRTYENRVQGYLKPCRHTFITKYAEVYQISESAALNQAVKALEDMLPKDIRERVVRGVSKNSY